MKTAYGTLAKLLFALIAALLLFAPMRYGTEDYLYAHPRSVRMSPGDSYALSYRLDSDVPQSVAYASTDESVATVTEGGVVTAEGPGKAQIRLDAENGARALVQIDVIGVPEATLTLNTRSLSMEKGQVSGLRAIFSEGAENTLVQWSSQNESVAQVDAVGRVSAVGGGHTRVVATAANGLTAGADIHVHVSGDAVRIIPEELTVGEGSYVLMGVRYLPQDTTDDVSRWTSSDENVMRVQNDGNIFAAAPGTAVLSVFSRDGLTASTVVIVEPAAKDFAVSPTAATLDRGSTLALEPRFIDAEGRTDENASGHYITWTSSNPAVATVVDGVITATGTGTARISAAADGKIASCSLKVQTPVDEIRLNLDQLYVLREQTSIPIQLEAEIIPADADNRRLTYETDNDLVAIVNQRGLVTLVGGYGSATITARASSGAEDRFTVNVVSKLPEGVSYPQD